MFARILQVEVGMLSMDDLAHGASMPYIFVVDLVNRRIQVRNICGGSLKRRNRVPARYTGRFVLSAPPGATHRPLTLLSHLSINSVTDSDFHYRQNATFGLAAPTRTLKTHPYFS